MSTFRQLLSQLHGLSFLLILALLPFHYTRAVFYLLIFFFATYLLDYIINQRYLQLFAWDWKKFPFLCCILLYFLLLSYYPLEENKEMWAMLVERRLSLLVFSVVGCLGFQPRVTKNQVAGTFILVGIGMTLYALSLVNVWDLLQGKTTLLQFNGIRHAKVAAHMAYNMYLNMGLLSCIWLLQHSPKKAVRISSLLAFAWIYAMISISDGRIGILCANLILLIGIYLFLSHHAKKWALLLLPLGILIIGIATLGNEKFQDMIQSHYGDPRQMIWEVAQEEIKENPWVGYGAGNTTEIFIERLSEHPVLRYYVFLRECLTGHDAVGAHPHNQFLQSWMDFGILGLLLTAALLISPFVLLWKRPNCLFPILAWLMICIQLQTDVIRGSIGYVAFCTYLLLIMNTDLLGESSKKESRKETISC